MKRQNTLTALALALALLLCACPPQQDEQVKPVMHERLPVNVESGPNLAGRMGAGHRSVFGGSYSRDGFVGVGPSLPVSLGTDTSGKSRS